MLRKFHVLFKTALARRAILLSQKQCSTVKPRAAIVLSGCGNMDGTEVHEACAVTVHICRNHILPVFYAPYRPQADVVDHQRGCPMEGVRCALTEAARIARGKICPLTELNACEADTIIFPGGFGVAKTLSTFATDGANCQIDREVCRVLAEFHAAKKPMGFVCIAPILAARMFSNVRITLGQKNDPEKWPHSEIIDIAIQMGADVEFRNVDEFCLDKQNFILSTPAFMYSGSFDEVHTGIGRMIDTICQLMK